jgi:thioredoxin 1
MQMAMVRKAMIGGLALLSLSLAACDSASSRDLPARSAAATAPPALDAPAAARPVPRLVDLGAGKCIPCKAMAPILDQLRVDYAGRMDVVFIDVWQQPEEARNYRINMIPTQIFYAADGRELARHEGFIDREGILRAWAKLGVEL